MYACAMNMFWQGYHPTTLPKGLKTNGVVEVSTWGGPVVRQQVQKRDRKSEHIDAVGASGSSIGGAAGGSEYEYHMFASTFVNGCNVWEWMSNSIITHAVSKSPLGPYEQRETIPAFHECSIAMHD